MSENKNLDNGQNKLAKAAPNKPAVQKKSFIEGVKKGRPLHRQVGP